MSSPLFLLAFLAFLATALVGPVGLLHPEWWLAVALSRLGVAVLRSLVEGVGLDSSESRSPKPLLLLLLLLSAVWTYTPIFGITVPAVWLVLVYLVLDTTVDRALVTARDPGRLAYNLGVVTYARVLGAGAGVFLWAVSGPLLAVSEEHVLLLLWTLLGLCVTLWDSVPEIGASRPLQRYAATLGDRGALLALSYFMAVIVFVEAGLSLDTPLPILHPERVSLAVLAAHFVFLSAPVALSVGWLGAYLTSRSTEVTVAAFLGLAYLLGATFSGEWWTPAVQRGLATGGILLLAGTTLPRMGAAPAIFTTNLLLVSWSLTVTADPLGGTVFSSGWSTGLAIVLLFGHAFGSKEPSQVRSLSAAELGSREASRRLDRRPHGDRLLDFEYGPEPPKRKRSPLLRANDLWILLVVKLPVQLTLVLGSALILTGFWYLSGRQGSLQQQGVEGWKTAQAQLYLSSVGRRLEEEMLATSRLPSDPQQFLSDSLELPSPFEPGADPWGTPLRLEVDGDQARWVSAGPDRLFGTRDDLIKGVPIPAGVRLWNKNERG